MRELQQGVFHWTARHPEWAPRSKWGPIVSSHAIDDGERLLLFDPLAVPAELEERATRRTPIVLLTAPWHERGTREVVQRFGAPVYTPPRETAQDLMQKYGVTPEQAAGGSPDLRWLFVEGGGQAHPIAAGDRLPFGVEVLPGRERLDVMLWIERLRVLIVGDTIADFGGGLQVSPGWLPRETTRAHLAATLRPLLALPVEWVLPAHGTPATRAQLERVLVTAA